MNCLFTEQVPCHIWRQAGDPTETRERTGLQTLNPPTVPMLGGTIRVSVFFTR